MDPVLLTLGLKGGAALAGGIGNIIAGNSQADAQRRAARQQEAMQREAIALQKERYNEAKGMYDPYIQAGTRGLGQYEDILSKQVQPEYGYKLTDFAYNKFEDPAAKMAMDNARRSLEASALSKGGIGGGTLRALNQEIQNKSLDAFKDAYSRYFDMERYKSGLADKAYDRDYGFTQDRLKNYFGLGNLGQSSVAGLTNLGAQNALNIAANLGNIGTVRSAGTVGANEASTRGWMAGLKDLIEGAGAVSKEYKNYKAGG